MSRYFWWGLGLELLTQNTYNIHFMLTKNLGHTRGMLHGLLGFIY